MIDLPNALIDHNDIEEMSFFVHVWPGQDCPVQHACVCLTHLTIACRPDILLAQTSLAPSCRHTCPPAGARRERCGGRHLARPVCAHAGGRPHPPLPLCLRGAAAGVSLLWRQDGRHHSPLRVCGCSQRAAGRRGGSAARQQAVRQAFQLTNACTHCGLAAKL